MALLTTDDLAPFATIDDDKAEAMVGDAVALAAISAPCLADPDALTDGQIAAAKAVLRAAVLRWADSGSGAAASQAWGSFSQTLDTRQARRTMFWPSEITALQKICKAGSDGGAFSIDTAAPPITFHSAFRTGDGVETLGAVAFDNDYGEDWPFQ
jgi:hypothetical protein